MNIIVENCQLEWQYLRGVLYIHNKDTGTTVLRIQGLPVPTRATPNLSEGMIDVDITKLRPTEHYDSRTSAYVSLPEDTVEVKIK